MQHCVWLSVSVTAEEMRWQDDILFLNSSFTDTAGGLNTWLSPLLPEPGDVTSAWNLALEWRPQRLSWAGTGAACRGNCVHQREENEAGARHAEWLCRMQSWELPGRVAAAGMQHGLQDGGSASAATEGKNLHLPQTKLCTNWKMRCAFVAIATGSQEFAWIAEADAADVSMQARVFADNKAVARKRPQQNAL